VGVEVLTIVILNPGNAQLEQNLACERGVWAEFEGFHGISECHDDDALQL